MRRLVDAFSRYLRPARRVTAADEEWVRMVLAEAAHQIKTGAPARTGTPANPTTTRRSKDMTSIAKTAHTVAKDEVIVRHPDHPDRKVELTVTATPAYNDNDEVLIDYTTPDGGTGRLRLSPVTRVEIRVSPREALIADLRRFATWLEHNPDVPTGRSAEVRVQYSVSAYAPWRGDYAAACAEVDRVAALIGVEAVDDDVSGASRREVTKSFGAVEYLAIAIEVSRSDRTTERPAEAGEVCTCGRPAVVVFVTAEYGDVPYCGISGGGHEQDGSTT